MSLVWPESVMVKCLNLYILPPDINMHFENFPLNVCLFLKFLGRVSNLLLNYIWVWKPARVSDDWFLFPTRRIYSKFSRSFSNPVLPIGWLIFVHTHCIRIILQFMKIKMNKKPVHSSAMSEKFYNNHPCGENSTHLSPRLEKF